VLVDASFGEDLTEVLRQSGGRFGHREHLHLAWRYVRSGDAHAATHQMRAAIQQLAARHGAPAKYHETLTITWLTLVAVHARHSEASDFDAFLAENEGLLDRDLPARHFSADLLLSAEARARLVDPDLVALPVHA
jgi:hypothetical protein